MRTAVFVPIASIAAGIALFCVGGLTPLGAQAVNLMLGGVALVFFGLGARNGRRSGCSTSPKG